MLIGIDESGTGAWAGPAMMAAVAFIGTPPQGLRDSKKLSDERRYDLTALLLDPDVAVVSCVELSVRDLSLNHQNTWNRAVLKVARDIILKLTSSTRETKFDIVVDGKGSQGASYYLSGLAKEAKAQVRYRFEVKADATVPEVSAASIFAKTDRNIHMRRLHQDWPVYGWDQNTGYGTADHRAAIETHGVTPHHRRIKPLRRFHDVRR